MFPHAVPDVEPPVGTVAAFHRSFTSGGGTSTRLLLRTGAEWSDNEHGRDARTWQELTDLEFMNTEVQHRNPRSTSTFVTVEVSIVAGPNVTPAL